jgi:hypothetical protein
VTEPARNSPYVNAAGEHDGSGKVAQVMEPDSFKSELISQLGKS